MYHNPVLLKQSVDDLVTNPDGIYVDCTFGGGGHSREILSRLSDKGRLFSFDQDLDALKNTIDDPRFTLVNQNFRFLENSLLMYGVPQVDGVLADLGVSSHQFDEADRGFSTRSNAPLDMRMNVMQNLDAKRVINEYEESELADLFYHYGELREARKLAREIVHHRKTKSIDTTEDLKKLFSYIPPHKVNKFYAQLFQAIRIEVNQELEVLKEMLVQAYNVLKPEGRLVVISYHSLEDRLVKRFLKNGMFEGEPARDIYGNYKKAFELIKSKAIIPDDQEIEENSRARSAKMRTGIKV
ncbi:16S rRNA (cytosine(1402)-N(4))-methyltransferase RsmH [Chryseobacterium panacisoli]|jgi:16S rRNA (cytosine1402-N4)-methyltransferase|uniref:Ribosomal RNA small subunit methyltransferase H n=2 Tax=Chryseobacterium TaxID=59732 RepID=A0A5B2U4M2_9FLAO|nr:MULTISPECIES: 16S rRNA (cytosine(1402)-N(4))-methyltransferase RsmH [Chryseobacterium]WPO91174.1 16S rRNA (cytosine(1402)-N(4))-methyltransferase RsmH [Chryseobacterium sp. HR92]KAA2221626.1 16S rRNA (cytosine(1402)-N(4))-methyltransferase RsmH [Chryseobacterium sediminis]MBB6332683.1 16S rRNA (cytosine1402-N4)-methyltransferase [Chryseobacterium sediminis]MCW1964376.1 16S rRNA (cytosine(1402)-N(4))-methyltransferase RsmH [Chryseobacterium viscerum]TZF92821.1 16S rRNA (cytosine(1402)-N(4))-